MEYFFIYDRELPQDVGISVWGKEHIAWLIIGIISCILLCRKYSSCGEKGRRIMRILISALMLSLECMKAFVLIANGFYSLYYLPLHLCSIGMLLSCVNAVTFPRFLGDFLYSVCMPGAVCALIFPDWTKYPALNLLSIGAFVGHILLVTYPIMLVKGGDIKPRPGKLYRCTLILLGIAVPIYFLNILIGSNYLFLNWPSPGSPLEFFEKHLGSPGYIAGYIPMLAAVWLLLYLPAAIMRKIKRGRKLHEINGHV